jgi:ABC-type dipeptide/oligopeptide/nickel transport system permease component
MKHMWTYIVKRILLMLCVCFIIMTMCFVMIRMLPNQLPRGEGDYAAAVLAMRKAWGYDEPILTQYVIFLRKVFTEWDWGVCTKVGTYLSPVTSHIAQKLPATVAINLYAMVISIPLGLLLGIYAALKKNKWQDHVISVLTILVISVPAYIYAFVLQYFFGYQLGWFPLVVASGHNYLSLEMLHSMVLPILSMAFGTIASLMRSTRAELTETLTSDYMLLARTKGLTRRQATLRHALRNSMVPILPMIISEFVSVLSGSLVIERIFGIPGIGSTYVSAILERDYALFLAVSMFYTVISLAATLVIDLSYGLADPRIRMGGGKNND